VVCRSMHGFVRERAGGADGRRRDGEQQQGHSYIRDDVEMGDTKQQSRESAGAGSRGYDTDDGSEYRQRYTLPQDDASGARRCRPKT
jgi:hypothetical protein